MTENEKTILRRIGKFGKTTSVDEWNKEVDKIKVARNGEYPPDWFPLILQDGIGWNHPPTPNPTIKIHGSLRYEMTIE